MVMKKVNKVIYNQCPYNSGNSISVTTITTATTSDNNNTEEEDRACYCNNKQKQAKIYEIPLNK